MSHPTRDVWVEIYQTAVWRNRSTSHPTRDVWVEMVFFAKDFETSTVTSHTGCVSRNEMSNEYAFFGLLSHPTRDVWVEIIKMTSHIRDFLSHPTRDVWVEILVPCFSSSGPTVTSHTGCVSRNLSYSSTNMVHFVTSHTGCVSRNEEEIKLLQEESKSHPTRDVWVEIKPPVKACKEY